MSSPAPDVFIEEKFFHIHPSCKGGLMRTIILKIGCLLLLLLIILPFNVSAKDTIQWRVTDWPPGHITEGPYKNQGTFDSIIRYLEGRMPEYHHSRINMTYKRLIAEIKKGINVCYVSATPRDYAYMSVTDVIELPHRIFIRKDKLHYIENMRSVSLDELLNNKRLKAGVNSGRYSKTLNAIFDKHEGQENLFDVPNYINESHIVGHVCCPKNEWGKTVIDRVNQVLLKGRTTPEYMEGLLRWYGGSDRETIKRIYKKIFSGTN
jgi:hypothetical protein